MTKKAQTEVEVRATGVRQLERIIDHLTAMKNGVEAGDIHYRSGGLIISEENDVIESMESDEAAIKRPGPRSWRIYGDLVFGTEKKE